MALVRGTPQLLVETDADGGLGFESRDGRKVSVVTRDNHAAEHAAMGLDVPPYWTVRPSRLGRLQISHYRDIAPMSHSFLGYKVQDPFSRP